MKKKDKEEDKKQALIQHSSKMELTIPDPDRTASFITQPRSSGGSLRLTIPKDIVELLNLNQTTYLEITVKKRVKNKEPTRMQY